MVDFPIEGPYGPVPIPNAFPTEAPPLHIPHPPDAFRWDNVRDFGKTLWDQVTGWVSTAASVTASQVSDAVHASIDTMTTIVGSYANLAADFTTTVFTTVEADISDLTDTALSQLDAMGHELDFLEAWAVGVVTPAIQGIEGEIANVWADAVTGIEWATANIETWAIDNIASPLLGQIEQIWSWIDAAPLWITTEIENAIAGLNLGDIADVLAKLGALSVAVAAIETWINDCGEPTCELVGPNSDWGKWLKLFGPLALWAMLAAVAAEDPHAIETLAEDLGHTLGPVLESWVQAWAVGGGGFPAQPGGVGGAIGSNPLVNPL